MSILLWIGLLAMPAMPAIMASEHFPTCGPESEYLTEPSALVITDRAIASVSAPSRPMGFCAEWNPDFPFNGYRCCTQISPLTRASIRNARGQALGAGRCAWQRRKTSYCDERTELQLDYVEGVTSGRLDPLTYLAERMDRRGPQAFCTVNNGFLAFGRPVLATEKNRLLIRNEHRCLNFGSDRMVGMLEWVGRRIAREYPAPEGAGPWLLIGDVSAPRGGCLAGRSGRRGHVSHTSGLDVDFAFFDPKAKKAALTTFSRQFDADANWWLIKQVFKNPFACVRVAFLDRTLIRRLARAAKGDAEWRRLSPYIRHSRGHANHWHVRIGTAPGDPGCQTGLSPEEFERELELELEETEGQELEDLEYEFGETLTPPDLKTTSGQGSRIKN